MKNSIKPGEFTLSLYGHDDQVTQQRQFIQEHLNLCPTLQVGLVCTLFTRQEQCDKIPSSTRAKIIEELRRLLYAYSKEGKYLGPTGKPLLLVDGPHAAPSQHYDEYPVVMLIGIDLKYLK